jgi:1,2-diacylglycerol 3-alpha-glucosyltransferase
VDGVVNSIRNTKIALEKLGHEVIVIAPGDRENWNSSEKDTLYCRAIEFRRYPGYRIAIYPTKSDLFFLEEHGVDIVHSHGVAFMGLKGMWAARELGIPMVLTFHTMILDAVPYYTTPRPGSGIIRKLISLYLRGFLHHCGVVVAPTRAVLRELEGIAPRMRRKAVVPNGVDVDRFRPGLDGRPVRERHGLEDGEVLLYVGRVAPEKDVGFLIEAFPRILERRSDMRLLLVGTGPSLGRFERVVEKMGLKDKVVFAGFVSDQDLPHYYAACDVMASASRFETQGLVALEAMACGKPVVAVNYRAFPDYLKEEANGFLFEPGDVEGFCDAVLKALDCDGDLKDRARKTAEEFSLERCTAKLLAIYEEMAAQIRSE